MPRPTSVYLAPGLKPIVRADLREGDVYIVATYQDSDDPKKDGPTHVRRHTWPETSDEGYWPEYYLIRRPVILNPGDFGTITTVEDETLPGYVNQYGLFIPIARDGRAASRGIRPSFLLSFTPMNTAE